MIVDSIGHELSVETLIDASSAKVWEVMTGRLAEWWCPRPWWSELKELDWRAGGAFKIVMHGPDGQRNVIDVLFLAVEPSVRFVFTDAINDRLEPKEPFIIGSWELSSQNGGTCMRASARHWTAEAMARHEEMGFADAWAACGQQLKALVEAN